ncbi:hypothetical protein SAMN05660748_0966 [Blastococcus aggregatus]|uniref:Uncharacterized protein n=1 Tax=Blastococcus aggregatus TaxID=38502 RepID=A0A285V0X3_9ACTN|nr:hypothetical protein [Blastococcus aggregatus]SOC47693.1 hypothetical protein SAMN05660748_0966 [Blastococcus aggregatus]
MRDLGHHRNNDEPDPGGRPIDINQRRAPRAATPGLAALLAGLVLGFAVVGVLAAAPAAAIDDPSLPDAQVTRGPSCQPGGLVVEVVAGTAPYAVRLATTRLPTGEDESLLQPGETVVLRTGDVAPGETIDGRLEFTAQDGSGFGYVDELDDYTFTRPTTEDCDKATAPPSSPSIPSPSPTPTPVPSPGSTSPEQPAGTPSSSSPRPTPPRSSPSSTTPAPAPTAAGQPAPAPPSGHPPAPQAEARVSPAPVAAGDTIRVRVDGYLPGERVTIALHGSGEVLGSAVADDDGAVVAEVLIPAWTASGPTSLDVVGASSTAAADVPLDVAAAATGAPEGDEPSLVPLLAAAGALVATGAGLVSMTTRRRPGR